MILALQIGDKHRVTTPVNWKKGDDVIVHPSVSLAEAKALFPAHTVHKVIVNRHCGGKFC
jgi:20S proteasome subunit alpha 2